MFFSDYFDYERGVVMYKLSVQALKPGMVLYDDIYNERKELLLKANTELSADRIQLLSNEYISEVALSEPSEIGMSHYKYLHSSEHFQLFTEIYNQSLAQFRKIIKNLDTGLDLNINKLLSLRDDVMCSVMNGDQLIDYLYNLMPNENEITYNHCFNCGLLCYVFAQWCGFPKQELDTITLCGFFFDIGKTKINEELLWKPDKLTPEEFIQMQHHIHLGYDMIKNRQLPPHVVSVLIMHHERCDGTGYPAHLKADRIDPYAMLAAIADTYEAMTHPRAQRLAMTPFQAIHVFENEGFAKFGTQNTKKILSRIASQYMERRVALNNGIEGKITEIHQDTLSRPTIYTKNLFMDLRQYENIEIVRMV